MSILDFPQLLTPAEVAKAMRVDQKTVGKWGREGRLGVVRTPTGMPRFFKDEIDAIIAGAPLTPEQVQALKARIGATS